MSIHRVWHEHGDYFDHEFLPHRSREISILNLIISMNSSEHYRCIALRSLLSCDRVGMNHSAREVVRPRWTGLPLCGLIQCISQLHIVLLSSVASQKIIQSLPKRSIAVTVVWSGFRARNDFAQQQTSFAAGYHGSCVSKTAPEETGQKFRMDSN